MAIQQTKKHSDLEKRLQILRRQVYGQKPIATNKYQPINIGNTFEKAPIADLSYLRQDLFKILIFSSLVIAVQIVLYILSQNHILNLKLF